VTDVPVGVGLGVSNGAQAAEVVGFADAVIVGSALVRCLLDADSEAAGVRAVAALSADLAGGMRQH
jgi:tryptophan synthase alpha chain